MKPSFRSTTCIRLLALVLGIVGADFSRTTFGAAFTWDGGGGNGNWSTTANWNPDGAPGATGNVLVFSGTTNLSATNDSITALDTTFTNTAITFAAGAGSFTLNGNTLSVGSGGGGGQIIVQQNSANNQTISLNLTFTGGSGDRSIVFASGAGSLTLGGNINFSNDWLFPNTTAGTIILSGANTGDGKAYNAGGITGGTNKMNAMMRNNVAATQLVLGSDSALGNSGTGSASAGTADFRGIVANQQLNTSTTGGNRNLPGSSLAINANNITFSGSSNLTIGNIITVSGNRDFVVSNTGAVTVSGGIFLSSDQTGRQLYINLTGAGGMIVNGSVYDTFHSGGVTTGTSTLRKASTGTLTLNGSSSYTALTQVDAGTLMVNGTHNQGSGSNAGRYIISSGATLGGNGTIKLSDSNAGTTGISVSGTLSPGDSSVNSGIGTLTINGVSSTRAVMSIETGAKLTFDLGGSSTGNDKVVLVSGQASDIYFNNNTIAFNDTTHGNLVSGQYVLFHSDASSSYSGLTVDGSNAITAGLAITGTGLNSYTSSQLKVSGNDIILDLVSSVTPSAVAIGMNITAPTATGMRAGTDVAGPAGARFGNWNNFLGPASGGANSSTNFVVDSTGASVTGLTFSFTGGNSAGSNATFINQSESGLSNDQRLFDTLFDQYSGTSTLTVTGIPYGTYDVYFFMHSDTGDGVNGTKRGGSFTVGPTTYYVRGGLGDPTSSGSNYFLSTDTVNTSGSNVQQGNYVKFTGLSGTSLTATMSPINCGDANPRLKFVGFQIVSTQSPVTQAPTAPTGITVTPSVGQVTIGWNASNTATSYMIMRSTTPNGTYTTMGTVSAFSSSYVDATITNGQTYYYKVVAANGVGQSAASSYASATPTDPNTMSVIGVNLRAYNTYGMPVTDTAGVVRVGYWNNLVGPVLQGETVTSGSGSLTNHLGTIMPTVAVSFTAGNTGGSYTNGGTLKFGGDMVTVNPATNDANLYSSAFDQYDTTPGALSITGIPYSSYDVVFYIYDGGSTQGGSITANGSTLSVRGGPGNPDLNGTGYVQSADTAAASGSTQQGNYVRFSGLSGDLTASFVAKNVGSSTQRLKIAGFQIVSNVSVPLPTQAPAAPSGLAASGGNQQVSLNWNATATATSYKVYRGVSFGSYSLLTGGTIGAPMTSYADTSASNGTTYYYAVTAVNSFGEGAQTTGTASATPAAPSFTMPQRTVYQWSLPMAPIYSGTAGTYWPYDSQRRAYLWIPPGCTRVQGVMVGLHNMLEKPMFDDPAIRQACTDASLAILFIAPGDSKTWTPNGVGNYIAGPLSMAIDLDPNNYVSQDIISGTTHYTTDINPATGTRFNNQSEQAGAELANLLTQFATESGYSELQYAPVLLTDHSAGSTFCWARSVPSSVALTGRVFAILPNKGTYPGNISNLPGIPIFHVSSEYQEISNWGNTWELGDAPAMRGLRAGGTNNLIGECVQPGTGHYEYVPEQAVPLAAFIKAAASTRIPSNWSSGSYPSLNTINPSNGWVIDVRTLGSGTCQTVSYATWVAAGNDPLRAYWYPDQTTAQAVCDTANAGFSKKPQMINAFQDSSTLYSLATQSSGCVSFGPTLQNDGVTFRVRAASVNQSPVARLYNAGPLGIASGPIVFRANGSGSMKQTGPDTFRVWLDRESVIKGGQPWEPFILACQPGDSNYRAAYRPIAITTAAAVNLISGSIQTISFPTLPNQAATSLGQITLSGSTAATASSGLPVQYWVASGPYRNDENDSSILIPDTIPASTKFPMRVVIGAWQWGRPSSVGTAIQSATPVYNTFWIFKNGIEKWRFDNFGYYSSGIPVTPAGNSDDTASPAGDGISNLMKYAVGMSPLTSGTQPATIAPNADGTRMTVTFNRIADSTLTYTVEAVDELTGTWTPIWSSTGASNVAGSVTVTDTELISNHPRRFLRLRVSY